MIYFTQLIYLRPGCEDTFDQFEAIAIPLIEKYKGQLLLRCRLQEGNFIETNYGQPYEIHLVAFENLDDFEAFKHNPERQSYLHLKEQSVEKIVLIEGKML